jgi:fucose 4-O-acetylase-like acetyltransferase
MAILDRIIRPDKDKIPEVVLLRGLAIMLVVFGHSDIATQSRPEWFTFLKMVVYTFHMAIFIMIAGYVFIYTNYEKNDLRWRDFMKKKLKRLILPATVILSFAFLLRNFLSAAKGADIEKFSLENYLKMFIYKEYLPIEFFWFTFCLIGIFILAKGMWHVVKKHNLFIGIALTAMFLILSVLRTNIQVLYITFILKNLLFFWIGCVAFVAVKEYRVKLTDDRSTAAVFSVLLGGGLIVINKCLSVYNYSLAELLSALCGLGCCFFAVRCVKGYPSDILHTLGNYSYQIFLLSWFFHRIVETIGFKILKLDFSVTYPLSFCCALVGPVFVAKLIERRMPLVKVYVGL